MASYSDICAGPRGLTALITAGLLACLIASPQPARAQTGEWSTAGAQQQAAIDPPGRIGRLSEVLGTVWLLHAEEGEWISALRNRPVTSGDRLSTEAGARLELQIGSTTLRLDGASDIEFGRIDDEAIEVHINAGNLALRVRNDQAASDVLLSTEDGSFSTLRAGSYRIERRDDRSEITVSSGQAVYNGPQSALTVYQGQRATFWIDANRRAQYSLGQPRFDAFASWNGERDRLADGAVAARYVSPEMTGYEDLDRYGGWTENPEYGALWAPHQVPSGWAPYAVGHWAWVSPWGWSWVDDAPWGFAPFHYGRWVVVDNRWWWAPGRRVARPIYAPALVGWIGGGGASVSLTIGGGRGIGWFPLAPREVYIPAYRVSRDHVRVVNGPHFRHPADIDRVIQTTSVQRGAEYRNRKFHHGTTAIPIEAFTRRGDDHGRVRVDPQTRRGDAAREIDRLPGSAVAIAPPPQWLGQGRDRRERPGGREAGDAARNPAQPGGREPGADSRRDGSGGEGWRRPDRRFENRRDDQERPSRDLDDRVRPPFAGRERGDFGRGQAAERPFFNPADSRADGPGRGGQRRGGAQDAQPAAPIVQAPIAPVTVAPIEAPRAITPVELPPSRPPRIERPDRAEQSDRPVERSDQRGGRPDRGMLPPSAERAPQPPAAAPIVQSPAPMMPAAPQMPAQPNRPIEPPRVMQQPPAEQGGRRMRAPRDPESEPRVERERRGGPGRSTEQP